FEQMLAPFQNGAALGHIEPADQILEAIKLGRQTRGADDADQRPSRQALLELFMVEFQAADSGRQHIEYPRLNSKKVRLCCGAPRTTSPQRTGRPGRFAAD